MIYTFTLCILLSYLFLVGSQCVQDGLENDKRCFYKGQDMAKILTFYVIIPPGMVSVPINMISVVLYN